MPKGRYPRRNNKKIDVNKAAELQLKGYTLQEIANEFQATRQAVHQLLKSHDILIQVLKDIMFDYSVQKAKDKIK